MITYKVIFNSSTKIRFSDRFPGLFLRFPWKCKFTSIKVLKYFYCVTFGVLN